MFLDSIRRRAGFTPEADFPWRVPLIGGLESLAFESPVTFLVGENGCGKSTLLEGLAAGMDAVAVGRRDLKRDETLAHAREFARGFHFSRRRYPKAKLFLRAEDVFGFTLRVQAEMQGLETLAEDLAREIHEGPGRDRAVGMARGQRAALAASYGDDPDGRSHGETFLALLRARLTPRGLYFLDEPETPLSPVRVLALMALMKDGVAAGSQFIVATHSPILMALPGARILLLEDGRIGPVAWDDVEHVRITRSFLSDPARYLDRL